MKKASKEMHESTNLNKGVGDAQNYSNRYIVSKCRCADNRRLQLLGV